MSETRKIRLDVTLKDVELLCDGLMRPTSSKTYPARRALLDQIALAWVEGSTDEDLAYANYAHQAALNARR